MTEPGARAPALHLGGCEGIASAVRRVLLLLALAGCAALLAACGKSSYSAHRTGSAAVARPATKVSTLNRPQALAYAHAVNLTAADVPGFTVSSSKESGTPKEKQLERELLRCVGPAGSAGKLAQVGSKEFELSHGILQLSVSSEVSVSETPAMAARELTAIRSAHVRDCFAHYLGLLLKGQHYGGATVGPVSVLSGTPPAPGTTGGFGWRLDRDAHHTGPDCAVLLGYSRLRVRPGHRLAVQLRCRATLPGHSRAAPVHAASPPRQGAPPVSPCCGLPAGGGRNP